MSIAELSIGAGSYTLAARRFSAKEQLFAPFSISVVARSRDESIPTEAVVGKSASFQIATGLAPSVGGRTRKWVGICSHFQLLRALIPQPGHALVHTYHARIVPALWLLTQRRNHRIFQHVSIVDIVKKILAEWELQASWRIDAGRYRKLEYKVQYGETDYAFMCRLLAEAGIAFAYTDPDGSGAKLIFGDAFETSSPRSPLVFTDNPTRDLEREFVKNVRLSREVRPGAFTMRDYDYRRPTLELFGNAPNAAAPEQRYERYHYDPGAFVVDDAQGGDTPVADDRGIARHDQDHGASRATDGLYAERMGRKMVSFETNVLDVAPGTVLVMPDHPHATIAGKPQLVTEFSIAGTYNGEWTMSGSSVFADMPFRPKAPHSKPRAYGIQTATVVGPAGQEIHTDEFGRVRVQFPWDREGQNDEGSSCWIRVSQGWAGTGYGMIMLPRIGQEVLVGFLDGDPEQPIVVGRVFNRIEPVPYALPDNKTISGVKSDSSLGSDGFNELKLEDLKGDELLYEQAEKNRRTLVKNNDTATILRHRQKVVAVNETDTTGNNRVEVTGIHRSETTAANRVTVIGGTRRKLIAGDEDNSTQGDKRTRIGKDYDLWQKKKRRELIYEEQHLLVAGDRRETIEESQSTILPESRYERVAGRYALETGKETHLRTAKVFVGEAAQDLTIAGPGGFIRIDATGVTIKGTMVYINEGGVTAGDGSGANPEEPEPPGTEESEREQDEEQDEEQADEQAEEAAAERPIDDPAVQEGMRQAWEDSQAGDPANRHEEGGYIVQNADGSYGVERWPRGGGAAIMPPARAADGSYDGKPVLGEFHTHPNPPIDEAGREWTQGGHEGDWNGIAAENYPGESYIISEDSVWVVDSAGTPTRNDSGDEVPLGSRSDLLGP